MNLWWLGGRLDHRLENTKWLLKFLRDENRVVVRVISLEGEASKKGRTALLSMHELHNLVCQIKGLGFRVY